MANAMALPVTYNVRKGESASLEWRMPVLLKPEEYDLGPWRYSGRSVFRRSIILVR